MPSSVKEHACEHHREITATRRSDKRWASRKAETRLKPGGFLGCPSHSYTSPFRSEPIRRDLQAVWDARSHFP